MRRSTTRARGLQVVAPVSIGKWRKTLQGELSVRAGSDGAAVRSTPLAGARHECGAHVA